MSDELKFSGIAMMVVATARMNVEGGSSWFDEELSPERQIQGKENDESPSEERTARRNEKNGQTQGKENDESPSEERTVSLRCRKKDGLRGEGRGTLRLLGRRVIILWGRN